MPSVFGTVAAVEGVNTQTPSGAVDCGADSNRVLIVLLVSGDTTDHGHPNAPTYDSVAMTQVGTIVDLRAGGSADGNRMASLWRLDDPASGSNTLTVDLGAARTQASLIPIPCSAADTVGASSQANNSSGTSNNPSITDTPNNADSLLIGLAAGDAGNIDPYTPGTDVTEIWDGASYSSISNHNSWAGTKTGSGAQTIDATQNANGEWAIWFVEVTAVSAATFTGSAAVTEGADTSTASGTFTAPTFTGTATPTEGADTSTASGTFVPGTLTGSAAVTEGADESTASGTFVPGTLTGSAAVTEGPDATTASGTFVPPDITGTAAVTEGADTSTATGSFIAAIDGSAAVTEGPDTSTASGTVVNPAVDHEPNPSEADSNTGAASAPPVNVPLGAVLAATGTSAAVPVTGKSSATVGDSGGTA